MKSSTGWGIFAVQVGKSGAETKHRLIMKGGTYYDYGQSSLAVETLALRETLEALGAYAKFPSRRCGPPAASQ